MRLGCIFFISVFLIPCLLSAQRMPGTVLVQMRDAMPEEKAQQRLCSALPVEADVYLAAVNNSSSKRGIYLLHWDEGEVPFGKFGSLLDAHPDVLLWQPEYWLGFRQTEPTDPLFAAQWNLEMIRMSRLWDVTTGGVTVEGDTIVVAIIDNGFDVGHQDLQGQLWVNRAELNGMPNEDDDGNGYVDDLHGWNFGQNSPEYQALSHGTSVAGIIGAVGNNDTDVAGINWDIRLMLFAVETASEVVDAYYYVLDQRRLYNQTAGAEGAFVVVTNASLGLSEAWCEDYPLWGAVYDSLGWEGVLSVSAVTNNQIDVSVLGDVPTTCPSDYLIATANTDRYDELLSSYGLPHVDLSAPAGVGADGLPALKPGDDTGTFGGSSGASPQVAATIALLYSLPSDSLIRYIKENLAEGALLMRDAVLQTTTPLESLQGKVVTGGRLDAYKAFLYLHARAQEYAQEDPLQTYTGQTGWVALFPNPLFTGQELQAWFSSENLDPIFIRISDMTGRELWAYEYRPAPFAQQYISIPAQNLPQGVYLLTLRQGDLRLTKKLVLSAGY